MNNFNIKSITSIETEESSIVVKERNATHKILIEGKIFIGVIDKYGINRAINIDKITIINYEC